MMIIPYILDQQGLRTCFTNMESALMNQFILMYESFNILISLKDELFLKCTFFLSRKQWNY